MFRKLLCISVFVVITSRGFSQAFTYYPFNSVFSIASNPNQPVWADFRFQMNSYFSSLSTEISPMVNVIKHDKARFYVGAGLKANFLNYLNDDPKNRNPLEGYFMNLGVRVSPFSKMPQFQGIFELSPYANKKFDLGVFRANLGIGYVFMKRKK
ncbi:hypothetical protein [Emticicia sp. 21SJ11W-3]|uniref:hypothetical protein n=1 Tax=Emticicia sp. 21SJ11W-3 TaxID=2916755 RepID=UPI0020A1874D|nr:hypothetical protein [Emticicia sp. 21SJ11W-3]UTA67783.1 hypothetical protein MB380_19610 [Emticicia sp. 21SJ11W-3]